MKPISVTAPIIPVRPNRSSFLRAQKSSSQPLAAIKPTMAENDRRILREQPNIRYVKDHPTIDTRVYGTHGNLHTVAGQKSRTLDGQSIMYVVDEAGALRVCFKIDAPPHGARWFDKHSTLTAGAPVRTAGHLSAISGEITLFQNDSGHYQPTVKQHQLASRDLYLKNVLGPETKIVYTDDTDSQGRKMVPAKNLMTLTV